MRVPTDIEMAARDLYESRDCFLRRLELGGKHPSVADMVALRSISGMAVTLAEMSARRASLSQGELLAAHVEIEMESRKAALAMVCEAVGLPVEP